MHVQGIQGSIAFDGEWVTVTKKRAGSPAVEHRIRAADISGTTLKPASRLFHGYVQFLLPGALAAPERRGGMASGRPPATDRNSLSIPHGSNEAAAKLVAAVEAARVNR